MKELLAKIDVAKLPQHVAIIMDGNGRWAKNKGEERIFGHKNAINAVRNSINACYEIGIPYLTLYTFSTENWGRPEQEVSSLMSLLTETLILEAEYIHTKGLKLRFIGDVSHLPQAAKESLINVVKLTKNNQKGTLILALNYGSQAEILAAVQQIAQKAINQEIIPSAIDYKTIEDHLYTKDIPPVDLMIRTSGETRISNFLLWQLAYAELQFLEVLWPDFKKEDFYNSIINYQNKERRFGKTSDQLLNIIFCTSRAYNKPKR
jgi:undecaprenyl diphosphate synthase